MVAVAKHLTVELFAPLRPADVPAEVWAGRVEGVVDAIIGATLASMAEATARAFDEDKPEG